MKNAVSEILELYMEIFLTKSSNGSKIQALDIATVPLRPWVKNATTGSHCIPVKCYRLLVRPTARRWV